MAARYLGHTNLLIDALDLKKPEKRERAGTAAVPTKALSEFANACLRKLEPRPDPVMVRREVERLLFAFGAPCVQARWCPGPTMQNRCTKNLLQRTLTEGGG